MQGLVPSSSIGTLVLASAFCSSQGARIHMSRSSSVVRINGMALGWIGSTMAFGAVVRSYEPDVGREWLRLGAPCPLDLVHIAYDK